MCKHNCIQTHAALLAEQLFTARIQQAEQSLQPESSAQTQKKKKKTEHEERTTARLNLAFSQSSHTGAEVAGWRGSLWSSSIPEGVR